MGLKSRQVKIHKGPLREQVENWGDIQKKVEKHDDTILEQLDKLSYEIFANVKCLSKKSAWLGSILQRSDRILITLKHWNKDQEAD
ncbi:hypothetical protein Tco_1520192 [Tanacetum coccineum]